MKTFTSKQFTGIFSPCTKKSAIGLPGEISVNPKIEYIQDATIFVSVYQVILTRICTHEKLKINQCTLGISFQTN